MENTFSYTKNGIEFTFDKPVLNIQYHCIDIWFTATDNNGHSHRTWNSCQQFWFADGFGRIDVSFCKRDQWLIQVADRKFWGEDSEKGDLPESCQFNMDEVTGRLYSNWVLAHIAPQQETEQKRLQDEVDSIKNGTIKPTYHEGEYLSGYTVSGKTGELLEAIGVAHYIDGWGYLVDQKIIDALGIEFTYAQADALTAPKRKTAADRQASLEQERQHRFDQARITGEPVLLRTYQDECDGTTEDCSVDDVSVYAMPDGATKTVRSHTW